MIIQKVPTKPTLIDLPSLSNVDEVKESHKDFYKESNEKANESDNLTKNLIE